MTDDMNILSQSTTALTDVQPAPAFHVQRTMTIEERARDLTEQAGSLRNRTTIANDNVAEIHHRSLQLQLDTRISRLVTQDPAAQLDELAGLGFAWRDIARNGRCFSSGTTPLEAGRTSHRGRTAEPSLSSLPSSR